MKITLDWQGGAAFAARTAGGHTLLMDGPPEHGGENRGPRPMEAFLSAAAACSAFDVVHILKKGRRAPAALSLEVRGERAADEPKVFTHVHLHFVCRGAVAESALRRAVSLSVEKYCSALRMLAASCAVSSSCEVKDG